MALNVQYFRIRYVQFGCLVLCLVEHIGEHAYRLTRREAVEDAVADCYLVDGFLTAGDLDILCFERLQSQLFDLQFRSRTLDQLEALCDLEIFESSLLDRGGRRIAADHQELLRNGIDIFYRAARDLERGRILDLQHRFVDA